jgi:DNA-binding MarR family transcriptional regulator
MSQSNILDVSKCAQISVNCTCFGLRKASRALTQQYDKRLSETGITVTQFSLLNAAVMARGMPISELADILVMDRTTLSRSLKPLVDAGFVNMVEGQDRRSKSIALSKKGTDALLKAIPLWEQLQEETMLRLGKDNWKDLMEKLRAMVALATLSR